MITKYINAHFAHLHSPTKEQRLTYFSKNHHKPRLTSGPHTTPEIEAVKRAEGPEAMEQGRSLRRIEGIQAANRLRTEFLLNLNKFRIQSAQRQRSWNDGMAKYIESEMTTFFETQRTYLQRYEYPDHREYLDSLNTERSKEIAIDTLLMKYRYDINTLIQKDPSRIEGALQYLNAGESYWKIYLQYLKDQKRPKKEIDALEAKIQEAIRTNSKKIEGIPSAFQIGDEIYFDPDHPAFTDQEAFDTYCKTKEEAGEPIDASEAIFATMKERAVDHAIAHELTHYYAHSKKRGRKFLEEVMYQLRETSAYYNLQQDIDVLFHKKITTNIDYIDEILAIYIAGLKKPYDPQNESLKYNIFTTLDQTVKTNPQLEKNIMNLLVDVDVDFVDMKEKFKEAWLERRKSERIMDDIDWRREYGFTDESENPPKDDGSTLHHLTNPDEEAAHNEVQENLEEEIVQKKAKTAKELLTSDLKKTRTELGYTRKVLEGIDTNSPVFTKLKPNDRSKQLQGIDMSKTMISNAEDDLVTIERYLKALDKWEHLDGPDALPVQDKSKFTDEWGIDNPYQMLGISPNKSQIAEADQKTKKGREKLLEHIATHMGSIDAPLKAIAEYASKVNKNDNADKKANTSGSTFNAILNSVNSGVEWLCWNDIAKIFSIYKEAIIESYKAQQNIVTNRIAQKTSGIMELLPFGWGAPVRQIINRQAKSANSEETSKYMEYLEKEGFTYRQIFEKPDYLLSKNRNNKNRFKAVLEYAADHAWLYEMDEFNGHNVYGFDYIKEFNQKAFQELVQKNEAGKKHEVDHGYERVDKAPDIPPMIDVMVHDLHEKNIYAVQGIMKRLQEKAKESHTNTWALVTLLLTMRDHPDLLESLEKAMMDNISNFTISQAAWSITWLKMLRNEIIAWKDGKGLVPFGNNILTETIETIENRFKAAGEKFDKRSTKDTNRRNEMIAKVLSGKTVTITHDGKTEKISIFEKEFNKYRDEFTKNTAAVDVDVKDTDPDYFNPVNNASDVLLINKNAYQKIFARLSTGEETNLSKARNLYAMIFKKDEELKDDPDLQDAYRNFKKAMKENFKFLFTKMDASRLGIFMDDTDIEGKNVMTELIERKMISRIELGKLISEVVPKDETKKKRIEDLKKLMPKLDPE